MAGHFPTAGYPIESKGVQVASRRPFTNVVSRYEVNPGSRMTIFFTLLYFVFILSFRRVCLQGLRTTQNIPILILILYKVYQLMVSQSLPRLFIQKILHNLLQRGANLYSFQHPPDSLQVLGSVTSQSIQISVKNALQHNNTQTIHISFLHLILLHMLHPCDGYFGSQVPG